MNLSNTRKRTQEDEIFNALIDKIFEQGDPAAFGLESADESMAFGDIHTYKGFEVRIGYDVLGKFHKGFAQQKTGLYDGNGNQIGTELETMPVESYREAGYWIYKMIDGYRERFPNDK